MKLKTVEIEDKTYAEIKDGKPVYVGDDGKEFAFDAPATKATIERVTDESKKYKERAQAAETKLKDFDGIENPKEAKKALEKVANWGDKELVEAGKVEEIKAAAIKAVEEKYKPVVEERDALKSDLHAEKIGGSFARSKFIADKIAVPADFIESRFGRHFRLEDGKVVAYGADGNPVYSKSNPGQPAGFDEALEILIDNYPHKDSILKGSGGSGSGKQPGGGAPGGNKQITRGDFDAMGHAERAAKMKEGYKVVDA